MANIIALVGNPNSGKTTLFNQLTGSHQYIGNWPGVTVEKKGGFLKSNCDVELVDLPGIYSLSPYTNEEVVAREFLAEGGVDAIINIVDATNLERNLYLTGQLMEFGVPLVVALNQMDLVEKRGIKINTGALTHELGVPVMEISALTGEGVEECERVAIETAQSGKTPHPVKFNAELELYLTRVEEFIPKSVPANLKRFYTVKAFEGDEKVLAEIENEGAGIGVGVHKNEGAGDTAPTSAVNAPTPAPARGCANIKAISKVRAEACKKFDDDAEGIITNERYLHISRYIESVYKRKKNVLTTTQKIDKVVTNRILALPIFVCVIFVVYFISVSWLGAIGTDWMNDGVFGEGWFLGPGQEQYDEACEPYTEAQGCIGVYLDAAVEKNVEGAEDIVKTWKDDGNLENVSESDLDTLITECKQKNIVATYTPEDEESGELLVDEAVEVDLATFQDSLKVEEPDPTQFGIWIPGIPTIIKSGLVAIGCDGWVKALVLDGIVAGVGAVLGFVPQIMILFFLLAILEGCGYMSRIAFILDRVFRRFGLSGKSFIPLLIGTGCGVPGIMASRTIEDESSRRLTIMTTTFMPCSAKLPIIALFAGAIFAGAAWVAPTVYFVGIASVIISGIMLRKTRPFLGDTTPFVMELPEYRLPRFVDLLRSMWERAWAFIKKAFVIILPSVVVVWFLTNFGVVDGAFGMLESDQIDSSLLAGLGGAIAWLFTPLGWGNWQAAAAAVTGLIAKENLVATLGVLYASDLGLWANMAATFVPVAALSLMFFNLLCAPCFAAMSAIAREMQSRKWFFAAVGYQTLYAYCFALIVYNVGGLITGQVAFNAWTVVAFVVIAFVVFMLVRPASKMCTREEKMAGTSKVVAEV